MRSGAGGGAEVVFLSGGFGGARLAPALRGALGSGRLTVVANVGDDLTIYGLRVCPDLDTNLYALAGVGDASAGWRRREESSGVHDELGRLASPWFTLGDKDLALHLWRTEQLAAGRALTDVMELALSAFGVDGVALVPACDATSETRIETADGRRLHFQEWYVREQGKPAVGAVWLGNAPAAPAALDALRRAGTVVLGPSNPVASVGAILAAHGMRAAVARVPVRVAVSPVVLGASSADPEIAHHATARANLLRAQGLSDTPSAIAALYADLVDVFVLDERDAAEAPEVEALGLRVVTTDLLDPARLAATVAELAA